MDLPSPFIKHWHYLIFYKLNHLIKYDKSFFDEDYITLSCDGGKLTARILTGDSVDYELDGMDDKFKDQFDIEVGNNSLLLIEYLSVNEESRGEGLAGRLLDKLFEVAKNENLKCLYLNASPIIDT